MLRVLRTNLVDVDCFTKSMQWESTNLQNPATVDMTLGTCEMTMRLEHRFVQVRHSLVEKNSIKRAILTTSIRAKTVCDTIWLFKFFWRKQNCCPLTTTSATLLPQFHSFSRESWKRWLLSLGCVCSKYVTMHLVHFISPKHRCWWWWCRTTASQRILTLTMSEMSDNLKNQSSWIASSSMTS